MNIVRSIVKQRFEDSISKAKDQTSKRDASKILEFVLSAGEEYKVEGIQNPPDFNFEPIFMACYHNSQNTTCQTRGNYLYCEGWAILEIELGLRVPHFHAWNVPHGKVIDITWNHFQGAKYYFGLTIPEKFVLSRRSDPNASCLPAWIGKNTDLAERKVSVIFDLLF